MRHAQVIFVPPWLPRLDSGESNREFFLVFVFLGTGEGAVCTFMCLFSLEKGRHYCPIFTQTYQEFPFACCHLGP